MFSNPVMQQPGGQNVNQQFAQMRHQAGTPPNAPQGLGAMRAGMPAQGMPNPHMVQQTMPKAPMSAPSPAGGVNAASPMSVAGTAPGAELNAGYLRHPQTHVHYGLYGMQQIIVARRPTFSPPPSNLATVSSPITSEILQQHNDYEVFYGSFLSKGFDLASIGLNVARTDKLYPTMSTLYFDNRDGASVQPEFKLPECYKSKPQKLTMKSFTQFTDETLFYIFYSMPRDVLQVAAAHELFERNWRFFKVSQVWVSSPPEDDGPVLDSSSTGATSGSSRAPPTKPPNTKSDPRAHKTISARFEESGKGPVEGTFKFFNPQTWKEEIKNATLHYEELEMTLPKSQAHSQQQQHHPQGASPSGATTATPAAQTEKPAPSASK